MRYIGTIEQGERLEQLIKDTHNCSIRKVGKKPDPDSQAPGKHTAYSSVYELYLDEDAKKVLNAGAFLDILMHPHAVVRIMYLPRDSKAEINIGSDRVANVCAMYPVIAELFSNLTYQGTNGLKINSRKHLTT